MSQYSSPSSRSSRASSSSEDDDDLQCMTPDTHSRRPSNANTPARATAAAAAASPAHHQQHQTPPAAFGQRHQQTTPPITPFHLLTQHSATVTPQRHPQPCDDAIPPCALEDEWSKANKEWQALVDEKEHAMDLTMDSPTRMAPRIDPEEVHAIYTEHHAFNIDTLQNSWAQEMTSKVKQHTSTLRSQAREQTRQSVTEVQQQAQELLRAKLADKDHSVAEWAQTYAASMETVKSNELASQRASYDQQILLLRMQLTNAQTQLAESESAHRADRQQWEMKVEDLEDSARQQERLMTDLRCTTKEKSLEADQVQAQMAKRIEHLMCENDGLKQEVTAEIAAAALTYEKTSTRINELEASLATCQSDLAQRSASLEATQAELADKVAQLAQAESMVAEKSSQLVEMDATLTEHQEHCDFLAEELEAAREATENAEDDADEREEKQRESIHALEDEIKRKDVTLAQLTAEQSEADQRKEAAIAQLTSELAATNQQVDGLSNELAEHQQEVDYLANELQEAREQAEDDVNEARDILAETQAGLEEEKSGARELQEKIAHLQTELSAKASSLDQLTSDLSAKDASIASLVADLAAARQEVAELTTSLSEHHEQVDYLESELQLAKEEVEDGEETLRESTETAGQLSTECAAQATQIADLASALGENEELADFLADELAEARDQLEERDAQLEEKDSDLAQKQRAIDGLQSELAAAIASSSQLASDLASATRSIESAQLELAEEARERGNMSERLEELQRARGSASEEAEFLANQRESLRGQLAEVSAERDAQVRTIAAHRSEIEALEASLKELHLALEEKRQAMQLVVEDAAALEKTVQEHEDAQKATAEELLVTQSELASRVRRVEELNAAIESRQQQVDSLESDLEIALVDIAQKHLALEKAEAEMHTMGQILVDLQDAQQIEVAELRAETTELRAEVSDCQQQIESLQQEAELAEHAQQNQQHRIQALNVQCETLENMREEAVAALQTSESARLRSISELKLQLENVSQERDHLSHSLAEAEDEMKEIQQQREANDRAVEELRAGVENLTQERDHLSHSLAEAEEEMKEIHQQREEASRRRESAQRKVDSMHATDSEKDQQRVDMEQQMEDLQRQVTSHREKSQQARVELEARLAELVAVRLELQEHATRSSQQLADAATQMDATEAKHAEAMEKAAQLQVEASEREMKLQEEVLMLHEQREAAQARVAQVETELASLTAVSAEHASQLEQAAVRQSDLELELEKATSEVELRSAESAALKHEHAVEIDQMEQRAQERESAFAQETQHHRAELTQQTAVLQDAREQATARSQELDQIRAERALLASDLAQARSLLADAEEKLDHKEEVLAAQVDTLYAQSVDLQSAQERVVELEALERSIGQLTAHLESMEAAAAQQKELVEAEQEEVRTEHLEQKMQMHAEVEHAQAQREGLEEKNNSLSFQLSEAEDKASYLSAQLSEAEEKNGQLADELHEAEEKTSQLAVQLTQAQEKNNELSGQLTDVEYQLAESERLHQAEIVEFSEKMAALEQRIAELDQQYQTIEADKREGDRLLAQGDSLIQELRTDLEIARNQATNQSHEAQVASNARLHEVEASLIAAQGECAALRAQVAAHQVELASLEDKSARAKEAAAEAHRQYEATLRALELRATQAELGVEAERVKNMDHVRTMSLDQMDRREHIEQLESKLELAVQEARLAKAEAESHQHVVAAQAQAIAVMDASLAARASREIAINTTPSLGVFRNATSLAGDVKVTPGSGRKAASRLSSAQKISSTASTPVVARLSFQPETPIEHVANHLAALESEAESFHLLAPAGGHTRGHSRASISNISHAHDSSFDIGRVSISPSQLVRDAQEPSVVRTNDAKRVSPIPSARMRSSNMGVISPRVSAQFASPRPSGLFGSDVAIDADGDHEFDSAPGSKALIFNPAIPADDFDGREVQCVVDARSVRQAKEYQVKWADYHHESEIAWVGEQRLLQLHGQGAIEDFATRVCGLCKQHRGPVVSVPADLSLSAHVAYLAPAHSSAFFPRLFGARSHQFYVHKSCAALGECTEEKRNTAAGTLKGVAAKVKEAATVACAQCNDLGAYLRCDDCAASFHPSCLFAAPCAQTGELHPVRGQPILVSSGSTIKSIGLPTRTPSRGVFNPAALLGSSESIASVVAPAASPASFSRYSNTLRAALASPSHTAGTRNSLVSTVGLAGGALGLRQGAGVHAAATARSLQTPAKAVTMTSSARMSFTPRSVSKRGTYGAAEEEIQQYIRARPSLSVSKAHPATFTAPSGGASAASATPKSKSLGGRNLSRKLDDANGDSSDDDDDDVVQFGRATHRAEEDPEDDDSDADVTMAFNRASLAPQVAAQPLKSGAWLGQQMQQNIQPTTPSSKQQQAHAQHAKKASWQAAFAGLSAK